MKGFAPVEQYDIVNVFLVEKIFEVLPKLGILAPFKFTTDGMIEKIDKLINGLKQGKDQSQTVRFLLNLWKEHNCEKYLEKNKNNDKMK